VVSVTNACLALHISFVPFMSVSIVLFAAEPELTKLAIYLKANQCYAVLVVFLFVLIHVIQDATMQYHLVLHTHLRVFLPYIHQPNAILL
jgi:hypothetical protein